MNPVKTNYGALQGIEKEGYTVFYGIPYAQPPVGQLRWRPPQKPQPWPGIRSAEHFPNRSMQETGRPDPLYGKEFFDQPEYQTPVSEDCLYLNIWTPAKEPWEKLPVAFWIHGGAFLNGYGHEKEFDGAAYCHRGVILVSVNYRLGPIGFLAHPWLSQEDRELGGLGLSGNYGILDQIAALEWVRENIGFFGGDPDNITVFGQSAGGMSVQTLVSSPLTKGMFSKAILQSCVGLSYDHTLSEAEQEGLEFSNNAGVHSLEEMRALSFAQIMTAAGPISGKGFATMRLAYTPVIDKHLLTAGYSDTLLHGNVHPIPYLIGTTQDDITTDPLEVAKGNLGAVWDGADQWCQAMVENRLPPAYRYYFTRKLPGDSYGAFHSAELWYMFGTMERCWRPWTEGDLALSDNMVGYWTNFMKAGDPNGPELPTWRPWQRPEDVMRLDV